MFLTIAALTFLTALCLFAALYLGALERRASPKAELRRRLQRMARAGTTAMPEELRREIIREAKPVDLFFARLPFTRNLDRRLDHAGLSMGVTRYLAVTLVGAAMCGILTGLATKSLLIGLLAIGGGLLCSHLFLTIKTQNRRDKFTELFPDALTMISRSLKAGHSFTTSIELVGQEIQPPVGELFKTAYDQQLLGMRITDSLANLNDRMESLDLRFFTTVIGINAEIGGNLSEVLDKLALTIRERLRIRRQVQVYTAQGRMSGYVVGVLPFVAFILFNVVNPEYESALFKEPLGKYILAAACGLQLIGLLTIRNIIRIRI